MTLRNLFNKPTEKPIGEVPFLVYKVSYDQFDDALELGAWLQTLNWATFELDSLRALKKDSPERLALDRTIAGCLALPAAQLGEALTGQAAEPRRLQAADVAQMPIVMVGEALAVVMEVNADFFFQTLPRLVQTSDRMKSIGSELLSSLLGPDTARMTSGATPLPSSAPT